MRASRIISVVPSILAMALHVATFFKMDGGPSAFTMGLLMWSWLPYTFCLASAFAFRSAWPAFVAGSLALTLDLVTFSDVFIRPTHSTAALGLLFAPLVNLVLVPSTLFLGWGIARWVRPQPVR